MKTYSRGNHSLSLVICIFFTTQVIISGCGTTHKQHLEPNRNQRVVSFSNFNRPFEKEKSFINSVSLPLSITTLNYSYNVPISKGEQEVEQQEHKFKRKSAFEWLQKYANKIKRYEIEDDVDNLNFNLNSYNFKQRGHWNSNYQDLITSKKNDSWILKYYPSESILNLDEYASSIYKNVYSNDIKDESMKKTDTKRINGNHSHQSNLIRKPDFYKNIYRQKRELNHFDNNRPRHDKKAKETKHPSLAKRKKNRKHGRMYFDKKESSANITILNGQTAFLTCTIRNVGNKSVSWLRLTKNPIPRILGMDNKVYTKDPRVSVIHDSEDPKLKEVFVLRIRHTRLSDGGRYECQVSANSRRKGARSRAIYHVISLDVVEPITWIAGGPQIIVDRGSTLNMTCVVSTRSKQPDFIIWSHSDRIILHEGPAPDQALPPAYSNKSISSTWPTDSRGRFISNLVIHNVTHKHAGEYKCEPAASKPAKITVHVQNGTDPQAVSDNGDGISSSLNGGVRSGKNSVNTHTSYDSIANVDLKRQHNGAMLKDKYIESTKLSEDAMRNQNKGLTEKIETALTSRSNVPHFSTTKLITIGCLSTFWRLFQI